MNIFLNPAAIYMFTGFHAAAVRQPTPYLLMKTTR